MAYITNKQFEGLSKVWTEIRDNNGNLSFETFEKYSQLMREIMDDKEKQKTKAREIIKERRKIDKNYARKKFN